MSEPIRLCDSAALTPAAWAGVLDTDPSIHADGCSRMPASLVAAVLGSGRPAPVTGLSEPVAAALRVVGAGPAFGLDPITAARLPFSAQVRADGVVTIAVAATAATVPVTSTPAAHEWAAHLAMSVVEVDLTQLATLNSVVIAWLLQLGHSAHPATIRLVGANRQVLAQLRQLRLDQVLTLA